MLRQAGYEARAFGDAHDLLEQYSSFAPASCVITDVVMRQMDGFGFADRIRSLDPAVAIIFMTAWPTTSDAVDAVRRHGGMDYLDKPIDGDRLLGSVGEAISWSRQRRIQLARLCGLTRREREIFDLLVKGLSTKAIAARLNLSPRTVDDHRAAVAAKTGATNLAQLIALSEGD
jgi:FixJ family two-component response regulator